jgi:hypothetical protein
MEYLPEKKHTLNIEVQKKESKIGNFREYLVESDVVLGFVKCKYPSSSFACSSISSGTP